MRLFSYVVAYDYGFAPNPFHSVCTLATCKPNIRRSAEVGDWVLGTGSRRYGLEGQVVFVMRVSAAMAFNAYWEDAIFRCKRPNLRGSVKQAFGDNIYSTDKNGEWLQRNSHHSLSDGSPNVLNIERDTQTDRVLVGTEYAYWGGSGPTIPVKFRNYCGEDICGRRGHKCRFSEALVEEFTGWFSDLNVHGYCGDPAGWSGMPWTAVRLF